MTYWSQTKKGNNQTSKQINKIKYIYTTLKATKNMKNAIWTRGKKYQKRSKTLDYGNGSFTKQPKWNSRYRYFLHSWHGNLLVIQVLVVYL